MVHFVQDDQLWSRFWNPQDFSGSILSPTTGNGFSGAGRRFVSRVDHVGSAAPALAANKRAQPSYLGFRDEVAKIDRWRGARASASVCIGYAASEGCRQRDLSSPGVSYAYISRIEAGARTPSVKAMRRLAEKLGVSAEYLETGAASALERGVMDAGVDLGSLNRAELRTIQTAADEAARAAARAAAEQVNMQRRKAEAASLRQRLHELENPNT